MKVVIAVLIFFTLNFSVYSQNAPNVLWIYADDMSAWLGCYGDKTVATPNIDMLAENGVKFERTYMPAPVCSTTRSALITGTMQTSHGLHEHRTMIKKPLPAGITTIPQLFRQAGYLTFNEQKTDYNFSYKLSDLYSPEFKRPSKKIVSGHLRGHDLTWLEQFKGKKFFGQIQLYGGKYQGEAGRKYPAPSRVKESEISVPPQYPDNKVMRNAMARHYEQIAYCDSQVGAIIKALKDYELWENTIVFFFTDHGCQMPRAKQHLYDEGTKVPLIVHWPAGSDRIKQLGTVRNDLVSGIDITTSTLDLAGLKVPDFMEGKKLFAKNYQERNYVISAKDRMGIAIDHVRAVRTEKFAYIKNYMTDRPLYQAAYRDGHAVFTNLRKLYDEGKLTDLQASYHNSSKRKVEELYDLDNDPHQLRNLALNPEYVSILKKHRQQLKEWEEATDDKGRIPSTREELEKVYKHAKGKTENPEYDIFKQKK
jgi:N-sulfoglucosamine sulfohydrolase